MSAARNEIDGGLRREAGMALPEILVAMLILALGSLAVLGSFDAATRNTYRAEQNQVAINIAQREMEQIRQLTYAEVALTTTPAFSSDPLDPRNRVNGSYFALNRDGTGLAEMAVKGIGGQETGVVNPGPSPFTNGDVSGKIYRYVTWQDDPGCAGCTGTHDFKRVVVVVMLDDEAISSAFAYDEVQSNFTDPEATVNGDQAPGGGSVLTAQQFFLSDTPCSQATRQEITADHAHHDTLGTSCGVANPPDTLFTDAPPDPDPNDSSSPGIFDYATDAALEPTPAGVDSGLQLLRQSQNGCDYTGGPVNKPMRIHRWVSEPMPQNFVMGGEGTLEFHTRTINDATANGAICVFLFKRSAAGVDIRLIDLSNPPTQYFTYSESPWPKTAWARRRLTMRFPPDTILTGQRLGVAIAVRRDGSSGDVLEFMYDHPDYPSRMEIKTTTPIG